MQCTRIRKVEQYERTKIWGNLMERYDHKDKVVER